jgi:S-adenosylmethionine/arginine decarboxylase-like enzyme
MRTPWGFALSLDLAKCKPSAIRCPYTIKDYSAALVKRIDMVPYGQPHIVRFGSGNKAGYTLVQLIETSNITGHFCEEDNAAFLDIFSCKPYDLEEAIKITKDFFEPQIIARHYVERSIPELM